MNFVSSKRKRLPKNNLSLRRQIMTLRIGIIGCGYKGTDHVERVANSINGATLAGVADIKQERAAKLAKKFNCRQFKTGDELIESPDIDAVMVVTRPHDTHVPFVLKSLEVGKYVFSEKPLSTSAEDCKRVVEAETKIGKRMVQVGFMRRYDNGYRQIKKAIDEGTYGKPLVLHMTHRNETTVSDYYDNDAIVETAIHECDIMHWLVGSDYDKVSCFIPGAQTKYTHKGLKDPQIMTFDTKSGVHADLEVFVNNHNSYDINCEVVCEEGNIALTSPTFTSVKTQERFQTSIPQNDSFRFRQAFDSEIQDWVNGVLADDLNPTAPTTWDGLMACVAADALEKSRDNGFVKEPVILPERPALYENK